MSKRILLLLFVIVYLACPGAKAQEGGPPKEKWTNRLITGGGIGLQFGDYTYVQITPILGYRVTDKFHAGIGLNYTYYKYNDKYYNYKYETSIYGGSIWTRYFIIENLFAEATYEVLNMDVPGPNNELVRDNIPVLMVGGGYAQSIGGQSMLLLRVLWDVIEDPYSPYANPIFSVGFSVGL